jgi:GT2 family glycosyltransferase
MAMKSEARPVVSVVVLSHDRPEYLPTVLDSIRAQTYPALEVVVVDNRSARSAEIARLVSAYEGFRLVTQPNLGYTGGMNRGLREAAGEYVYLTVDDCALAADCIERLVEEAAARPFEGLLAGILMFEDRRTIACAGGEFALAPVYRRRNFGAGEEDAGQFKEPFEASCLDGAMVFGRLSYLRALGGFREEFFIYADSIELSARVRKAGGRIRVVPAARAYVYESPHAFTEEGVSFHKMKNLWTMYLLHARWRVLPEFFLRYALVVPLRSMRANRKTVGPLCRAWAWFLRRSPSLLLERVGWGRPAAGL